VAGRADTCVDAQHKKRGRPTGQQQQARPSVRINPPPPPICDVSNGTDTSSPLDIGDKSEPTIQSLPVGSAIEQPIVSSKSSAQMRQENVDSRVIFYLSSNQLLIMATHGRHLKTMLGFGVGDLAGRISLYDLIHEHVRLNRFVHSLINFKPRY
jgi:hypothetical protein